MQIERTESFTKDFKKLPLPIKRRTEEVLHLLASNLKHPSLRSRITDKKRRIWKVDINGGYRFTFRIEDEIIVLRRAGAHDEMERPERW
ncbi:hypothetical protein HY230_03125 [Candidatus Acetothermia bacterium]|nr:hypothetical protein [Candidatus Acetothermia bacterium]